MATGVPLAQARSPLEQAIAEKKDRRARYERSMREQGFKKCTLWIKAEAVEPVRFLVRCVNDANGAKLADLHALTETWEHGS